MFKQKKTIAMLGMVAGMAMAFQGMADSHMGPNHYAVDGANSTVKNIAGDCWSTVGGKAGPQESCGDSVMMEKAMAPEDSDGDGVIDAQDKCPGTRAGAKVDQWGCEIIDNLVIDLTEGEFDFDSATLKPAMEYALDSVARMIKDSPGSESVTITGHTDSIGAADYNQGLSERRAQAARDYLESMGVDGSMLDVRGEGEESPIADNGTNEGRAMNRRIEVHSR
ncbi:MAG: OmpA family protein [Gammaproteobacteria bacterium]|nr:OmpA family protein [Gammaproteobacteria bacterium]